MSLLCWFTDDATLDLGYKLTAVLNHWVWAGEDTLRDSRSELESRRKKFVATQTQCEWHSNYELAPPPFSAILSAMNIWGIWLESACTSSPTARCHAVR